MDRWSIRISQAKATNPTSMGTIIVISTIWNRSFLCRKLYLAKAKPAIALKTTHMWITNSV